MWWVLQSIIISIIIITILHYGWDYLKTTYSTHKIKDIAKIHAEKYDHILSELLENKGSPEIQINPEEMENDLAIFLEQTLSEHEKYSGERSSPELVLDTNPLSSPDNKY